MRWQDLIPLSWRRHLQMSRRNLHDRRNGTHRLFAQQDDSISSWPVIMQLSQPVRQSYLYENKLHNIQLAGSRIQRVPVHPATIFSFWKVVGYPGTGQGYKVGRNLVGGHLREDIGGGLCQLSGLIYHLSLLAGLETMERHAHSKDIYTEEERYTPLGADATVAYGYKDLRLCNPYEFPIGFEVHIDADRVTCLLRGLGSIEQREVEFRRQNHAEGEEVFTICKEENQEVLLARSVYFKK